jgi:hypothetical protein
MLMDDYCDDLSNISFFALEAACRMYRQDIKSQFFPRAAELKELAVRAAVNTRHELHVVREKLYYIDTSRQLSQPERADPATVDKILKGLYENLRVDQPEKTEIKEAKAFDKAYFEGKSEVRSADGGETEQPS